MDPCIAVDRLALIAARGHVVEGTGELHPQRPSHRAAAYRLLSLLSRPDPNCTLSPSCRCLRAGRCNQALGSRVVAISAPISPVIEHAQRVFGRDHLGCGHRHPPEARIESGGCLEPVV